MVFHGFSMLFLYDFFYVVILSIFFYICFSIVSMVFHGFSRLFLYGFSMLLFVLCFFFLWFFYIWCSIVFY